MLDRMDLDRQSWVRTSLPVRPLGQEHTGAMSEPEPRTGGREGRGGGGNAVLVSAWLSLVQHTHTGTNNILNLVILMLKLIFKMLNVLY